jgi:aldose 1-epimerase
MVVYVPPGKSYFAVEPVTNANDGFNLFERCVRGSGIFVLEPGEERAASLALVVAR